MAILETLTIDGTSMDVHSANVQTATQNISLSTAGTTRKGAAVTVTDEGVYAIVGKVVFQAASTTGSTYHASGLNCGTTSIAYNSTVDATNQTETKTSAALYKVTSAPVEFSVDAYCNKAISTQCTTTLDVFRLIDL